MAISDSDEISDKSQAGPINNRKCRDIFWAVLFVLFWVGMFVIAGFAISQGDIARLKFGTDSEGNFCGVNNDIDNDGQLMQPGNRSADYTNKKMLLYFMPTSTVLDFSSLYTRCVSECPRETNVNEVICRYEITPGATEIERAEQVVAGNCTIAVASREVFYRCVPEFLLSSDNSTALDNSSAYNWAEIISYDFNSRSTPQMVFQDISVSWEYILAGCAIAFVVSIVWLVIMQLFSGVMLWATILASIITTGATAGYCLYNYYRVNQQGRELMDLSFTTIDNQLANEKVLITIGVITGVIFLVLFFLAVFLRKRIQLAVTVLKEASHATRTFPTLLMVPIIKYIELLAVFAWVVYIWCLIATSGKKVARAANDAAEEYLQTTFEPNDVLYGFNIYYLFGLLWTINLIKAIGQTTVAGVIATWYWTRNKKDVPGGTVFKSFWRTMRYHFGSLALGSLILGFIQFIRYMLRYMTQKARASKNRVAVWVTSCLNCCCGCIEWIIKVINTNAYIEIAIYGYSYCKAARTAFKLITRNALRLVVLDKVCDFFLFLGKMFICCISGIITLYLVQRDVNLAVSFYSIPVVIVMLFAYFVASVFFSNLEIAIDTIFLSFCEDCERNDGSPEKPYFMTENLRRFTNTSHTAKEMEQKSPAPVAGTIEMPEPQN